MTQPVFRTAVYFERKRNAGLHRDHAIPALPRQERLIRRDHGGQFVRLHDPYLPENFVVASQNRHLRLAGKVPFAGVDFQDHLFGLRRTGPPTVDPFDPVAGDMELHGVIVPDVEHDISPGRRDLVKILGYDRCVLAFLEDADRVRNARGAVREADHGRAVLLRGILRDGEIERMARQHARRDILDPLRIGHPDLVIHIAAKIHLNRPGGSREHVFVLRNDDRRIAALLIDAHRLLASPAEDADVSGTHRSAFVGGHPETELRSLHAPRVLRLDPVAALHVYFVIERNIRFDLHLHSSAGRLHLEFRTGQRQRVDPLLRNDHVLAHVAAPDHDRGVAFQLRRVFGDLHPHPCRTGAAFRRGYPAPFVRRRRHDRPPSSLDLKPDFGRSLLRREDQRAVLLFETDGRHRIPGFGRTVVRTSGPCGTDERQKAKFRNEFGKKVHRRLDFDLQI